MASSLEAIKAQFALIRLKLALQKSGAGKSGAGNYTRYPAGNTKGGQFAPKGTGAGGGGGGFQPKTLPGENTFYESGWKGSGMWAKPSAPPAGAKPHPQTNDQGKPVSIDYPSKASHPSTWTDRTKSAVFTPGGDAPATLNGVAMKAWNPPAEGWSAVKGTKPSLDLDTPFVPHPTKNTGAGVIIVEPDGRLWLTRPTNAFGGYQNTYPKGTAESGLTLQQNAIKEAHEETGLKVQITGILGDFERDTSKARFYIARRVGGTPKDMGWESQAMTLATLKDARKLLNRTHDRAMLDELEHLMSFGKAKGGGGGSKGGSGGSWAHQARWPGGSALGGQWKATGADGITLAPTVAGGLTGSNPIYQKTMNAAASALSSTGDVGPVKAAIAKFADKAAQFTAGIKGSSHIKWGAQVHQWATQAVADHEAKIKATASVDAIAGPKTLSSFGLAVGAKPGGSNPGAMYQENGDKWLVKGNAKAGVVTPQQNDDRAKNEVLASHLMLAAGVGAPDMKLVELEGKFGGGLGVASKMVEGATSLLGGPNDIEKAIIKKDFAVHAWLANYDVLGMGYDNTVIKDGKAINIDPGGALLFRAQGLPKDLAAHGGVLDPKAPEFETMRKNTSEQVSVFGSMTNYQLRTSAQRLENISDDTIRKLVNTYGPGDAAFKTKLAENLIERKQAIVAKANAYLNPEKEGGIPASAALGLKPERIKSTVDQKAVEVEAKAISAAAPKVDIPNKPVFNTGLSSDKFYDAMVKKFEAAHAKGDMAALKEGATGGKYVNGLPWKPGTTNGIKIANYYNALVADLNMKAAATTVATAKVADAVVSKPAPVPAPNTMTPPAGGAMPNFEATKLAATNQNAKSHNPKVDLLSNLAMAGDVKGLLALPYGTNTYGKQQVKLANAALAALGSPHVVVKGQLENNHPALYGGATLQTATAAAALVKTPLPVASTAPDKAAKAVKESVKASKKKDWLQLQPGEKILEQGEEFGVKYAHIQTPAKGFKPEDIPLQPDFFKNGNQGPTNKWKSSSEAINKANNDAVNLIHAIATSHNLLDGQSHVDAIKNIQFPVFDKATGTYGTKTIGIADHPASAVKEYHGQVLAELQAQTETGYKTVQSGTFTGAYGKLSASLSKSHPAIPYEAFKNAQRAADYVVLSKDAASSIPIPKKGDFKEITMADKVLQDYSAKSKAAFAAMSEKEQTKAKQYTGSFYDDWNTALRKGDVDSPYFEASKPMVAAFKKASLDVPAGSILWRGIGVGQSTYESVTGGVIQDGSFNSASFGATPAFASHGTWLKIHVAEEGVRGVEATTFSEHGSHEREIIIQNGVRYAVLKVTHHKQYVATDGSKWFNKTIVEVLALPHKP
jgi:hypothetical protein